MRPLRRDMEDDVRRILQTMAFAGAVLIAGSAVAADYEVQMLNRGPDRQTMHFEPAFLKIEPGDTVTFLPIDRGHNSESLLGMIPDGASTWKGEINEAITVTFDVPGLYGYKCQPHLGMGMVGLIQVGDSASNLQRVLDVRLPPRAQGRMFELLARTTLSAN
jgi:pseudoazurin